MIGLVDSSCGNKNFWDYDMHLISPYDAARCNPQQNRGGGETRGKKRNEGETRQGRFQCVRRCFRIFNVVNKDINEYTIYIHIDI